MFQIADINEYNVTLSKSGEVCSLAAVIRVYWFQFKSKALQCPLLALCGLCVEPVAPRLIEGTVEMDAQGGLLKSHEEEGFILTCCSYPNK